MKTNVRDYLNRKMSYAKEHRAEALTMSQDETRTQRDRDEWFAISAYWGAVAEEAAETLELLNTPYQFIA